MSSGLVDVHALHGKAFSGLRRFLTPVHRTLGYNNIWISAVSILATFDIKPGPEFAPEKLTMGTGLIAYDIRCSEHLMGYNSLCRFPESFPISMTPRSMEVVRLIRELDSK